MSSKEKLESVKKQIEVIEYQLNSWQAADYRRGLTIDQLQAKRDRLVSLREEQLQANQAVFDEKMATGLHATRQEQIAEGYKAERAKIEAHAQQKALERREALKKHHSGLWKAQGGDEDSFEGAMAEESKQKMSQVYQPRL